MANLLTSKRTDLSCPTLDRCKGLCHPHPRPFSTFLGAPSQPVPGPPSSPEATTTVLICFLPRLVLPAVELHRQGGFQKVLFCVRVLSLSTTRVNTEGRVLKFSWGLTVQTRLCHLRRKALALRSTLEIEITHDGVQSHHFPSSTQVLLSSLGPLFQIPVPAPKTCSDNHPRALWTRADLQCLLGSKADYLPSDSCPWLFPLREKAG